MQNKKKLLIGVTGGIGSGKSLVCGYFKELGGEIFYADKIARDLYSTNDKLRNAIIKEFGKQIIDEDGNISFPKFRAVVFKNDTNQKRVNRIVHPFAIKEILRRTGKSRSGLIFVEAALVFESGFDKYLDYTIEVFATVDNRIRRVRDRNNLSVADIRTIMKLQMNEKDKLRRADFVIKNNASKRGLKKDAETLYNILKQLV
ncbi:MAG: dephospho-CoA kinase [Ignavibacteria bacterium]